MTLHRMAGIVCGLISLMNTVIMVMMMVSYQNMISHHQYYIWMMMIPIAFSLATAVCCAGGYFPFFLNNKTCCDWDEENPSETPRDWYDNIYMQEASTSLRRAVESSTSLSFFASGDTEFGPLGDHAQHQVKAGKSNQTEATSSKRPVSLMYESQPEIHVPVSPTNQQRKFSRLMKKGSKEDTAAEGGAKLTESMNLAEVGSSEAKNNASRPDVKYDQTNSQQEAPKNICNRGFSENTSLLAKKTKAPVSLFDDRMTYGSIDTEFQKRYPFPMYGIMPNMPELNITEQDQMKPVQSKSMEENRYFPSGFSSITSGIEKSSSWPCSENMPPVFHFTPARQKPEISEEEEDMDMNSKVDLKLPKSSLRYKVAEWLVKSPTVPMPSAKFSPQRKRIRLSLAQTPDDLKVNVMPEPPMQGENSNSVRIDKDPAAEVAISMAPKTEGPNKFCILGRGYFYASETEENVPVKSPSLNSNSQIEVSKNSQNSTSESLGKRDDENKTKPESENV